jgi:hypothetical protein
MVHVIVLPLFEVTLLVFSCENKQGAANNEAMKRKDDFIVEVIRSIENRY